MNRKVARKSCIALFILHSIYVCFIFGYIHLHPAPQDYMLWSKVLGLADEPFVGFGLIIDRHFNLLGTLTYWWHSQGFSGHNIRHGLVHLVFGGAQWALAGLILGSFIAIFKKPKLSSEKRRSPEEPLPSSAVPVAGYVPAHQAKMSPLFVSGIHPAGQEKGGPSAAYCRYLKTECAGFAVYQQKTIYFLKLKVLSNPEENLMIRIEYENPIKGREPISKEEIFPKESEELFFRSPPLEGVVKGNELYIIKVSIFQASSERKPIDLLVQQVRSYIDNTTGYPFHKSRMKFKHGHQVLLQPES